MERPDETQAWKRRSRKRSGTRSVGRSRRPARKDPGHADPVADGKGRAPTRRRRARAGISGPDGHKRRRHTGSRRNPRHGLRVARHLNPTRITLSHDLLVPYGVPKWEIGMVRLSAVTPHGSHLTSSVPLVHIRPCEKEAYRLGDHARAFGLASPAAALAHLRTHCDPRSESEAGFLDAYRRFLEASGGDLSQALAPIPQAHLYLDDPLDTGNAAEPGFMVKADFAFWTGGGFAVVEIDGGSHIGNPRHITKDRALRTAGVEVVHILNEEIVRWGPDLILRLLPQIIG